ncbi:MAG: DSD1 family PLP-dependent enzyme [Treponema sp.]|nr:DSD1 family PLP-dependent enzyme [Treponema sp.]
MKIKQLETPVLVLDMDKMEENIRTMQELTKKCGIALRPHYKSHKCPQIAKWQMEAGAVGISCAKLAEAEDLINAGLKDVLIANQVISPSKISRLAHLAGSCHLGVCVDDEENILNLEKAAALAGTKIYCLIEYEVGMNRCGVETKEEFLRLAKIIEKCPHLVYEGIQAYAGHLAHRKDHEERKDASMKVDARVKELIDYLEKNGMKAEKVSGVSTGTSIFKEKGLYTEMQAGSYLFMDGAYAALGLKFINALFILAEVLSTKKDRVVVDAGLKSIGTDQGPPRLADHLEAEPNLSEEHTSFSLPGHNYKPGDKVFLIPGHNCTTVNLHNRVYMARGEEIIGVLDITSRGRSF